MKCWIGRKGILYGVSKPGVRNLENYRDTFELYRKFSKDGTEKLRVIGEVTDSEPSQPEVRDMIASELPKYLRAVALVSAKGSGRAIEAFVALSKAPYPIRVYSTIEEAEEWLSGPDFT